MNQGAKPWPKAWHRHTCLRVLLTVLCFPGFQPKCKQAIVKHCNWMDQWESDWGEGGGAFLACMKFIFLSISYAGILFRGSPLRMNA